MGRFGLFSALGGLTKWALGALGGAYVVEKITKDGAITNTAADVAMKGVAVQSEAQALDGNIDTFFNARNSLQGITGVLSSICALLHKWTGAKFFKNWEDSLTSFNRDERAKIYRESAAINASSMTHAADRAPALPGYDNVNPTTPTNAGPTADQPSADQDTSIVPTALGIGGGLATTWAGSALLGKLSSVFSKAAVPAATATAPLTLTTVASRGGKVGLIAAGVGLLAGAGYYAYDWMTSDGKNEPNPDATNKNPDIINAKAPVVTNTHMTAIEPSVTSTLAVGTGAVLAAKTLGVKAVPVLGGAITAWDTLWEVGGDFYNGEWKKGGTALVAGAGLTLGATGGFLTYGLGEAWHNATREAAIYTMGQDAAIDKSPIRTVFEVVSGVNTDITYDQPKPVLQPRSNQPILAMN